MNFLVQLPCCYQFVNVVIWLKLILSLCVLTVKMNKNTYSSYFNNIFYIEIRNKIEKKSDKFKGINCGNRFQSNNMPVVYHPFSTPQEYFLLCLHQFN